MACPALTRLIVVIGLLSITLYQAPARANVQSALHPITPQTASSEPQWAMFDVTGSNGSGSLQVGEPLELSITFGGAPHGSMPIVAICESAHFESQIITLKPDPSSSVMKATTIFAPVAHDRLATGRHISRLHVTFARSTETKFERLMTRVVYLTIGSTKPTGNAPPTPSVNVDQPNEPDLAANQVDHLPDAIPLVNDEMVEEDLIPSRSTQPSPAYWGQVRDLLNRSWHHATGHMPASLPHQTVQVQFRLYPGGGAQLMQIANESGAAEIDQAGIHAIAHAQPFPPFPIGVGNKPIDIHVRLQTGSTNGVQEFRTSTPQNLGRTINEPKN